MFQMYVARTSPLWRDRLKRSISITQVPVATCFILIMLCSLPVLHSSYMTLYANTCHHTQTVSVSTRTVTVHTSNYDTWSHTHASTHVSTCGLVTIAMTHTLISAEERCCWDRVRTHQSVNHLSRGKYTSINRVRHLLRVHVQARVTITNNSSM